MPRFDWSTNRSAKGGGKDGSAPPLRSAPRKLGMQRTRNERERWNYVILIGLVFLRARGGGGVRLSRAYKVELERRKTLPSR